MKRINYKHINHLAKSIYQKGISENDIDLKEAYLRTAVSRAYYATFHLARDKMETIKLKSDPNYKLPIGGSIHGAIKKFWTKEFGKNKSNKYLGKHLKQLRIKRNQADYDLIIVFNKSEAGKYMNVAQLLINKMERK